MTESEARLVYNLCNRAEILESYLRQYKDSAIKKVHMTAIKIRVNQLAIPRATVQDLLSRRSDRRARRQTNRKIY